MNVLNAHEALNLPTVEFTERDRKEAVALMNGLREHIKHNMKLGGTELLLETTNPSVIAYINAEMNNPARGWNVEWEVMGERSKLDPNRIRPIGYKIKLAAKPEILRAFFVTLLADAAENTEQPGPDNASASS